jgi:hypothetical protein
MRRGFFLSPTGVSALDAWFGAAESARLVSAGNAPFEGNIVLDMLDLYI